MKHSLIITLIALLSLVSVNGADESKHLFILSGQSNMARLDPDISFRPTLEKALGKENVIIVKDALGGKPIRCWYKNWKPEKSNAPEGNGDLYDRLMLKVNAAIKGKEIKSVTFVWMHGERDANERQGKVYADSLKGLFKQLASDLKRKEINVVIGRINDFDMKNQRLAHWTMVREAQVEVAESLARTAWVNTDDLNGEKNDIHALGDGYEILGERFAKKAIKLLEK